MPTKLEVIHAFETVHPVPVCEEPGIPGPEISLAASLPLRNGKACDLKTLFQFRQHGLPRPTTSQRVRVELRAPSGSVLKAKLGGRELQKVLESGVFRAVRFPDTGADWFALGAEGEKPSTPQSFPRN